MYNAATLLLSPCLSPLLPNLLIHKFVLFYYFQSKATVYIPKPIATQ